jgi:hypothetical protein
MYVYIHSLPARKFRLAAELLKQTRLLGVKNSRLNELLFMLSSLTIETDE